MLLPVSLFFNSVTLKVTKNLLKQTKKHISQHAWKIIFICEVRGDWYLKHWISATHNIYLSSPSMRVIGNRHCKHCMLPCCVAKLQQWGLGWVWLCSNILKLCSRFGLDCIHSVMCLCVCIHTCVRTAFCSLQDAVNTTCKTYKTGWLLETGWAQ